MAQLKIEWKDYTNGNQGGSFGGTWLNIEIDGTTDVPGGVHEKHYSQDQIKDAETAVLEAVKRVKGMFVNNPDTTGKT